MEAAGIEPGCGAASSSCVTSTYDDGAVRALHMRCIHCGVEGLWMSQIDAGLQQLIEDWDTLPPHIRQAILTLAPRE